MGPNGAAAEQRQKWRLRAITSNAQIAAAIGSCSERRRCEQWHCVQDVGNVGGAGGHRVCQAPLPEGWDICNNRHNGGGFRLGKALRLFRFGPVHPCCLYYTVGSQLRATFGLCGCVGKGCTQGRADDEMGGEHATHTTPGPSLDTTVLQTTCWIKINEAESTRAALYNIYIYIYIYTYIYYTMRPACFQLHLF